ncbi:MAG: type I secretion system permease/ATPase [Rhodospirillaceae bacterium]|nr:type I secretion system permease/ATPase [Rhodospirillaceae bacterium]
MSDISPTTDENEFAGKVKAARAPLWAVGGFSFVVNMLMLTISIYMMQVFDRVLTSRSTETLLYLSVIAIGAVLILAILDYTRSRIMQGIGVWMDRSLARSGFERAVEAELAGTGARTQILRDQGDIRNFLSSPAMLTMFDVPWVPVYIAFVYMLHGALGNIALAGAVVLFMFAFLNDATTSSLMRVAAKRQSENMGDAASAVRNAEVIDALGMKGRMAVRFAFENDKSLSDSSAASARSSALQSAAKFFRLALQIILLGTGAYLVLGNEISPGAIIAASIIASRALAPLEQSIGSWKQAVGAYASYKRLGVFHSAPRLREDGTALPTPEGKLDVESISYIPQGAERAAISKVAFKLKPGEMLGVAGPSASGKTTLARLLVGVAGPQIGTVRLDGADVFTWPRGDIGRHIGYLPQDIELFSGTVRENIARLSDANDTEVITAAKQAGAHEMILRLPGGYDTNIGDGGKLLAGGQRQRIALARALLGDVRFVVLDEPNANLDSEGDQALALALAHLKERGITTVVLGHRMPFVELVDKMVVLKEGQMVMFGPREKVIEKLRELDLARVSPEKDTGQKGGKK